MTDDPTEPMPGGFVDPEPPDDDEH
jgi:hypothetical protein